MEKIKLVYRFDNSVAHITLDDGKGNVLDHLMMDELQQLADAFGKQQHLKLIVIQGAGKHFSFGASVEEHQREYAEAMLRGFHRMLLSFRNLSVPMAAVVSGQCLGGGLELALICHQMFADRTARFGQPEIVLGVFPPPASILLPEKIGLSRAEDLLLTGRSAGAEEAYQMGLVNRLFETRAELDAGTDAWIEEYILPKSASSLRYACQAGRIKFNHVFNNFLPQLEQLYLAELMNTHDANEGIRSFMEKRKPEWRDA
ncbi:MAG: enoyl-CoA hydratase/isomerase family protein [Saprospiraceae bacterium]|nr:enoyl-CoA hydratase/isomerase family protein [Saprospiraceae bacterium]MBP9209327.1 enoyl-CoA hydratase/isomerase family protein [Saprospiraceae bacterium]